MNYRRLLGLAAPGMISIVSTSAVLLPNTFFLDNVTDATRSYRNGFEVDVSPNAHHLLFEAKADLASDATLQQEHGVTLETLNKIRPYTIFGFDVYRLGSIRTDFGARIGIPEYFKHAGEEFSTKGIMVNNASVPWSTPEGQKLRQSFIISDEAKKFAIARELLSCHQYELEKHVCAAAVNLVLPFMIAQSLTDRLQLKSRPKLLRVVVYGMVAAFAAGMWVMTKDSFVLELEKRVDTALCSLSDSYRRGGLEFYLSLQQRNLALRSLLGEFGPKVYTALGNDETLIRLKTVPIVERVEFFKKEIAKREEVNKEVDTPESNQVNKTPEEA